MVNTNCSLDCFLLNVRTFYTYSWLVLTITTKAKKAEVNLCLYWPQEARTHIRKLLVYMMFLGQPVETFIIYWWCVCNIISKGSLVSNNTVVTCHTCAASQPLSQPAVQEITSVTSLHHIMPMETERIAEDHKRKELSAHGFSLVFHTSKNSLEFDDWRAAFYRAQVFTL